MIEHEFCFFGMEIEVSFGDVFELDQSEFRKLPLEDGEGVETGWMLFPTHPMARRLMPSNTSGRHKRLTHQH